MSAATTEAVTPAQLEAARHLIELALGEERDPHDQKVIREIGEEVARIAPAGAELGCIRRIVADLRICADKGSPLHDAATAWLALRENGGDA